MQKWIYWTESGVLAINPAAQNVLHQLSHPEIVTVLGFSRIGKSFLLNQLCGTDTFPVSPGVSICTRGLQFLIQGEKVFIDTEGLAGMAGGPDHDAKIFLLAFLLSSVLIYCSKGVIDEPSINQLSFVTQLTTSLQTENRPGLVWLLKDFALDLRSLEGAEITSGEYLTRALSGETPLRSLIRDTFPIRECATLVRPCQEEADLYEIPEEKIRPEFTQGINRLRHVVGSLSRPRSINGKTLSGAVTLRQMLCELADRLVKMLNAKELPQLGSVWDNISEERCELGKLKAVEFLSNALLTAKTTLPMDETDLKLGFKRLKAETLKLYRSQALGDKVSDYESDLRSEILTNFQQTSSLNYEISQNTCMETLRSLYQEFIEMLDFHSAEELAQAWTEIKNEYDNRCKGPAKPFVWNFHATEHILQTMRLLALKMETKQHQDLLKLKTQLQQVSKELDNSRKGAPEPDSEVTQKPESCQECGLW